MINNTTDLITPNIESIRRTIARDDLLSNQSKHCQYFTPSSIAKFMASLFGEFPNKIKLLDPGFGIGSLSAAFIEEIIRRNSIQSYQFQVEALKFIAFEIDEQLQPYVNKSLNLISNLCEINNISIDAQVKYSDFIKYYAAKLVADLFTITGDFSHVIMNPPYGKIRSDSKYRNREVH